MKTNKLIFLLVLSFGIGFLFSSCGGGGLSDNPTLGKLPALADKYESEIDSYIEKAKQSTDMEDAFKYDKKQKLAKEEANKVISEYAENNLVAAPVPFDPTVGLNYEVVDLSIKGASRYRVNFEGNVKITEDIIGKYGSKRVHFFAYIMAVDKEGAPLGKVTVMSSKLGLKEYTKGLEVPIGGSLGHLRKMEKFDRIVFISKEEYDAKK